MKKKILLYSIGYVLFFFPLMNLFFSVQQKLPFFDKETLAFSIPVTIFGFLCVVGVVIYENYKVKK
ncbi:hypothetical protein [Capnocytophaga sp. H4358]|uniref:hypothetical protein n=1 Tax=Capnocytophaga sp. H4358 TaxID=1945658 RepID=UPI0012FF9322|nr:hypothetical protein [Capnocytophaga sp. H4358]